MEMWNFDEEFQFILEMLILKRNENGATLLEIRGNSPNSSNNYYRSYRMAYDPIMNNVEHVSSSSLHSRSNQNSFVKFSILKHIFSSITNRRFGQIFWPKIGGHLGIQVLGTRYKTIADECYVEHQYENFRQWMYSVLHGH